MIPANPLPHDLCVPLVGCAGSVGSAIAGDAAGAVLSSLAGAVDAASQYLVKQILEVVGASTEPLSASGLATAVSSMRSVVLVLLLPILCVATIGPVLRQDLRRLLRVWGVGLPVAVFGGLLVVPLTQLALAAVDDLCSLSLGQPQSGSIFGTLMSPDAFSNMPAVLQILVGGVGVAGALLVWLELVVRSAAVYIAVLFTPLALVAFIWPATTGMAKRAVEMLAALVLSKFVIVATLNLGLLVLADPGPGDVLPGCAILLVAAFAPFVLFRMAPVIEAGAIAHLEGLSRTPIRAAQTAAATAASAGGSGAVQVAMGARSAAAAGPSTVGAVDSVLPSVPAAKPDFFASDV